MRFNNLFVVVVVGVVAVADVQNVNRKLTFPLLIVLLMFELLERVTKKCGVVGRRFDFIH